MSAAEKIAVRSTDVDRPYPRIVYLETTSDCNARCVMCPHADTKRQSRHALHDDDFSDLIRQLASWPADCGLAEVHPFLNNEPLMDGQLASRVRLIRTELPHVKTRIFTNGALLTHSRADELAESGIHAVTFSLHAATETTYQSVMRLSGFERTKERIEYFANVAAGRDIRIKVTIVDLTLTAGESDDTKKYWADRGIDAYVTRAVNWAGNLSDESTLPTYLLESETDPCHRVMREMYISASGNVILCCADWREEVVFGSIRTAPLETIWRSDEFRTYRKRHWDRRIESLPLCNRCTYARRRRAVPSPAGE